MSKKPAADDPFDPEAFAERVRASAQQIWLAGMGAFAKAQQEGGKVFETLVAEGGQWQRKAQAAAQAHFGDLAGKFGSTADEMGVRAGQQWGRVEALAEAQVQKALGRLGVPSRADLDALTRRLDSLSAQLERLAKARAAPARAAAKKAAKKTTRPVRKSTP